MNVRELRAELFDIDDQEREILVEDTDGWKYDFFIVDEDGHLSISPLTDTRRDD
jgi:hypothetical protein